MLCLVAQSCLTLCDLMDCCLPGSSVLGDSSGKNTGVGSHSILQEIFPTQGSNLGLLHCRQILYHLSHQGNPKLCGMAKKKKLAAGEPPSSSELAWSVPAGSGHVPGRVLLPGCLLPPPVQSCAAPRHQRRSPAALQPSPFPAPSPLRHDRDQHHVCG